jgi:4-amino-4-deoxy-L-arabinose transferase-like glycosyltransferase
MDKKRQSTPSTLKRWLPLIIGLALLARVAAALYLGNTVSGLSGAQDEISYSMLGHRFSEGFGLTFPRDWYPWIKAGAQQSYYSATISLFLAAIYTVFGYHPLAARLIMAGLSTGVVIMIFVLARRFFGAAVGLVAAAIASGYAYLVFYGVTLVTETPFILLLLLAIEAAFRIVDNPTPQRWLVFSIAVAGTILLRMAVLFFVVALALWVFWRLLATKPQSLRMLAIPAAVIGLAIAPFTIHNYQLWGRFLLLESQFGHVFWNGNHPDQPESFHDVLVLPIPEDILASDNDAVITNRLLSLGIENVMRDPGHFARLTLGRLREFFTFWPTSDSAPLANALRVASFGVMLPFALAGLWLTRARWRELLPLLAFIVIHTAIYSASWTMIRYRIPLDAALIPFAACALAAMVRKARESRAATARPPLAT